MGTPRPRNVIYGRQSRKEALWVGLSEVTHLQGNKDARHVKTYEVALKDKDFVEGPWSQNNLDNGANLLIPVPPPLCGVIIIGEETIVYCSANAFKAIPIRPSITRAYGRVDADGSRYLLGDHTGLLHLLVITHEKER
nr:dna damage-binding protein 1 [Quercus suber]